PDGMANAFTQANNARPIPADMMMRKDLMPPELVAMIEGRYRPKNGPVGPPMLPGMMPPGGMPASMMQPGVQQAVALAPMPAPTPAPAQQVSEKAAVEQLRAVLRDALLPSEREEAADHLARYEAHRM